MNSMNILALLLLLLLFSACNSPEQKDVKNNAKSVIISHTYKSTDGTTLDLEFKNSNESVVIEWKDKTLELKNNRPASGIWYKNNEYELRGKGDEIKLSKNGVVVFQSNKSQ